MASAPRSGSEPLVILHGVGYAYPGAGARALDGIQLEIRRGEFVGLIGPTGAGKSTLCLTLNGIVPQFFGGQFYGHATVAGADTVDTPTSRLAAAVGMVLEDPETQIISPTVEAEVAFALENLRVPTPDIVRRVEAALEAVGLAGLERKHPANLSGGQKQRLSIAAALALAPDVIVLDEPTSQLDPAATRDVFGLLRRLNREQGITIVLASHASEELAVSADRILLLSEGRAIRQGPPAEVFGDVAMLARLGVRPPDIAQAFTAVAQVLAPSAALAVPVRMDDAAAAFAPFRAALDVAAPRHRMQPASIGPPVLEAVGVTYAYPDGTQALNGVNLSVGRGEFVAIAGQNGCGKSTLVRHFLHLLRPASGRVRVEGAEVADLAVADLARRIGYVSQNAHQHLFCDSVAAEVAFAPRMMEWPAAEIEASVESALQAMRLEPMAGAHPMALSRGDRLRVAIAVVLALGPDMLVFDEPTTGQDWRGALAVLDICRDLNRLGRTVVLVTHHLYLLPGYAARLVVMAGGRIVRDGPLQDVLYDEAELSAAALSPPQTVAFATQVPTLALPDRRPLSPAALADCIRPQGERAA